MNPVKKPLDLPDLKVDVDDFILDLFNAPSTLNTSSTENDPPITSVTKTLSDGSALQNNDHFKSPTASLQSLNRFDDSILSIDSNISATSYIKSLYSTPIPTPTKIIDTSFDKIISNNSINSKATVNIDKISPISSPTFKNNVSNTSISPFVTPINNSNRKTNDNSSNNNNENKDNSKLDKSGNSSTSITRNLLNDFSLEIQNTSNHNSEDTEYNGDEYDDDIKEILKTAIISPNKNIQGDFLKHIITTPSSTPNTTSKTFTTPSTLPITPLSATSKPLATSPTTTTTTTSTTSNTQTQTPQSQIKKKGKRINYDLITGKQTRPMKMVKGYLTPIKKSPQDLQQNQTDGTWFGDEFTPTQISPYHKQENEKEKEQQEEIEDVDDIIAPPVTQYDMNRCFDNGGSDDEVDRLKEEEEKQQQHHKEQDEDLCPICQSNFTNPYTSQCNHICCYECWQQWLALKLECPVCRERTRVKHLKPKQT